MSSKLTDGTAHITPQMIERATEALSRIWASDVAEGWMTSRDVVHCVLQAALHPSGAGPPGGRSMSGEGRGSEG